MQQAISFITIGVNDLQKMKVFYKEIFEWTSLKEQDDMVVFQMNGFILALFPIHLLAEDINVANDGQGFKRFALAINLSSEQEVNETFNRFREKGVKIVREPEKVFWGGYRGYIADPEDNHWEFAYNPLM